MARHSVLLCLQQVRNWLWHEQEMLNTTAFHHTRIARPPTNQLCCEQSLQKNKGEKNISGLCSSTLLPGTTQKWKEVALGITWTSMVEFAIDFLEWSQKWCNDFLMLHDSQVPTLQLSCRVPGSAWKSFTNGGDTWGQFCSSCRIHLSPQPCHSK